MSERPAQLDDASHPGTAFVVKPTVCTRVYHRDDAGQVAFVQQGRGWALPVFQGRDVSPDDVLCEHVTPEGFEARIHTTVVFGDRVPDAALALHPREVLARWRRRELELEPATLQALAPSRIGGEQSVPELRVIPLWTPTLPPATHTNCYVLGEADALVVDPGTHRPDELDRLVVALDRHAGKFGPLRAIVLTHHHIDHVSGVAGLVDRTGLPVWAHAETAARIPVSVDRTLGDGEALTGGWSTVFTPGHAPGHLALWRASDGAAVVGDLVASVGTILVDPKDGDMGQYLESLERMRGLTPTSLHPAHGGPIWEADQRLSGYLQHRRWREALIWNALDSGARSLADVTRRAYAKTPSSLMWLAERSALAHLQWLATQGRALEVSTGWQRAT